MNLKSLFFIVIAVFGFYELALLTGRQNNQLAFVFIGILFGWGLDYFIVFIKEVIKNKSSKSFARVKILDSSAIIDGRIVDIIDSDFIDGDIVVPKFVLEELQLLSDSEDNIKRARGRRGLDLIKAIQGNKKNKVIIEDRDYKIKDVDAKIIKLGKDINGDVVTTDFNLNKVATIQGLRVLNVNKLSNALKPMVIPNEELVIELMKSGDRDGQAVGYLNDGTMVVAEDGGDFVGKTVTLIVTSVYPTAAGRMIFGRIKKK